MKQKISSRILILLISVVMLITALPLNSLTAFADEYTGSGSGSADVDKVGDRNLSMNGNEYGVRIYCITKDKAIKAGETYSAVDLWFSMGCLDSLADGEYSYAGRFGGIPAAKVARGTFGKCVSAANEALKKSGKLEGTNAISDIPSFAGFDGSDFYMSGIDFRQWATGKVTTDEGDKWNIQVLYYAFTGVTIEVGDFLVIEPLMCLPVVKGTYPNGMWYDGHHAGTWYDYMYKLDGHAGGTMMNIKAAWGNGFVLDKDKDEIGLSVPGRYKRSITSFGALKGKGWGLHVLKTTDGFGGHGDPIDSYDITANPTTPNYCEPPKKTTGTGSYDNTGNVTIVKTYIDLYKDENGGGGYTQVIDRGTFIKDGCSNLVVISNEEAKTGYKVKAWYTSKSVPLADEENYKGSSMILSSNGTSTTSGLGAVKFKIEGYDKLVNDAIICNGSKSYNMKYKKWIDSNRDGIHNVGETHVFGYPSNCSTQYTRKNALTSGGKATRIKTTAENKEYIELAESDKTVVILYVREHGWIDSSDWSDSSGSSTITYENDPYQELKIVKCYGKINPATYEVVNDKDPVKLTSTTRNVHITPEDGYRLAEFVYCTRDDIGEQNVDAQKWCQINGTTDKNKKYQTKGFIDGFSGYDVTHINEFGSSVLDLVKKRPNYWEYTTDDMVLASDWSEDPIEDKNTAVDTDGDGKKDTYEIHNLEFPGTIGRGRLSGSTLDEYDRTIYFGEKCMPDRNDTSVNNDTLYILFLVDEEVEYEATDFVIPESYITRHNDFATNKITVGGADTASTKNYLFQEHKFQYSLPVLLDWTIADWAHITYKDPNYKEPSKGDWTIKTRVPDSEIVSYINQKGTGGTGLVSAWSKTEWLGYKSDEDLTADKISRISLSNRYMMAVSSKAVSGGTLSFSNANYNYVAYRHGDKPTIARWKHNQLSSLSTSSDAYYNSVKYTAVDSSSYPLFGWTSGYNTLKSTAKNKDGSYVGIDIGHTITAVGNIPSGTRATNEASHTFKLNFKFSDVYGNTEGHEKDPLYNVPLIEMKSKDPLDFTVGAKNTTTTRLTRVFHAFYIDTSDGGKKRVEYKDGQLYIDGATHATDGGNWNAILKNMDIYSKYVENVSDIDLIQTVTCKTHYGTAKSNTYTDNSKPFVGDSKTSQSGGYQVLEADNTFTFYPYHVMQIDTQGHFNQYYNASGEVNTSNKALATAIKTNDTAKIKEFKRDVPQVYVLGEELRQLNCYSYGGVSFSSGSVYNETTDTMNIVNQVNSKGKKSGKIQISSEQWSTHARATAATNGMQNCVLPGGASLTLTIPTDNRQTVTVTTYTPFLAGNGLDQVQKTGDVGSMPTDINDTKSTHENLIKSVANGLESLNVKQYVIDPTIDEKTLSKLVMDDSGEVIKLPDKNVWDYDKGSLVEPGGNQLSKGTLSTQDKYYFREDGDLDKENKAIDGLYASNKNGTGVTDGEANTGDLDTSVYDKSTGNINIGSTTTKYYTFYMNRVGEVYCISDSTIDGAAKKANILGSDGDKVAYFDSTTLKPVIVADGIILDIAKKTDIVNQLYTQLEEGTGEDSSAYWSDSNGAWYYEAFDGITIAHMSTTIQVGFIDSYERTSVLDPKLTPSASSKGDILEDYTYSQFKMADHSLLYGTPNKIGEYKVGGTTYNITVPDLSSLFVSDIFIIPNATVQDLK